MASHRRTVHSEKRKLFVSKREVANPKSESSRAKFFKFDDSYIDQDLKQLFTEVNNKSKDCLSSIVDSGILLSTLVTTLGYSIFQRLVSAIHHVPEHFPDACTLICNIVNVDDNCLSVPQTEYLVPFVRKLNLPSDFSSISDDIMWKCQSKYKQPFHHFLVPPVTTCIECMGTLYSYNKTFVTVFTLNGPLPAQKLTLRCKKGCGSSYSIDTYSTAGVTKFYDFPTRWIAASNKVYISDTVQELMCESG